MSMVFQEPEYQFLAATVAEELAIGPRAVGMTEEEIAPSSRNTWRPWASLSLRAPTR